MSFTDKVLTCRDCGAQFTFTTGEQEFYAQKGFTNPPARCPSCRRAQKQSRDRDGYNSRSHGGGYGSSRGQRERELHITTCSACGREARVPFVPRGDRPVYCADCFQSQRTTRHDNNRW